MIGYWGNGKWEVALYKYGCHPPLGLGLDEVKKVIVTFLSRCVVGGSIFRVGDAGMFGGVLGV
jgi:hypothetical protein